MKERNEKLYGPYHFSRTYGEYGHTPTIVEESNKQMQCTIQKFRAKKDDFKKLKQNEERYHGKKG